MIWCTYLSDISFEIKVMFCTAYLECAVHITTFSFDLQFIHRVISREKATTQWWVHVGISALHFQRERKNRKRHEKGRPRKRDWLSQSRRKDTSNKVKGEVSPINYVPRNCEKQQLESVLAPQVVPPQRQWCEQRQLLWVRRPSPWSIAGAER